MAKDLQISYKNLPLKLYESQDTVLEGRKAEKPLA